MRGHSIPQIYQAHLLFTTKLSNGSQVFLSFVFVFCPLILAAQIVGYFDQQTGAPHALAGQNHLFLHYHDPNFTIQIELLNVTI